MIDTYYLTENYNSIFQCAKLKSEDIPFSQDVRRACEANACGRYGKCWTCPPGVGKIETLKSTLLKHENTLVFTLKGNLLDSFDIEGMEEAGIQADKLLRSISADFKSKNIPHIALGRGSCSICSECTYPNSPCRFPERAIPSVESCGIDVVELAAKCKLNYHNGTNTVTYFCLILY